MEIMAMIRFDNFKSMTLDQFTEWLDKYGQFDNSPWISWFDEKYCSNCESIMCHYEDSELEFPCSWCELENKCRFFPDMDHAPDNKDIIKMWLESEGEIIVADELLTDDERKQNQSCGWCNKYDEVLCDDWGNCFKYCPICGRNLGNGI